MYPCLRTGRRSLVLDPFRRRLSSHAAPRASTLSEWGWNVLTSKSADEKAKMTQAAVAWWNGLRDVRSSGGRIGDLAPPPQPSHPEKPILVDPKAMPSQKDSGASIPQYLLHNLAHIELNAVDLGWDLMLRFKHENMPEEFFSDWLAIVDDEARHFLLLSQRLEALGAYYGSLPAHNNLWKIARSTSHSLAARIAIIQLVQEARGLDSHERLVSKFYGARDPVGAKLIDQICKEEVKHVQLGVKWFKFLCQRTGTDPIPRFHQIVQEHLEMGKLPPPFNVKARQAAGLSEEWYVPLSLHRPDLWRKATPE